MAGQDHVAMAMMAMAETLRLQQPPKHKMAIKCARGALTLNLSPPASAHVQLQLGKLILFYTENLDDARQVLESAYQLHTSLGEYFVQPRLDTLALLCQAYLSGSPTQQGLSRVLTLIPNDMILAKDHPEILQKLFYYFIEASTLSGMVEEALNACEMAVKYSNGSPTVELFFRLTKFLVKSRLTQVTVEDTAQDDSLIKDLFLSLDEKQPIVRNLKMFYMSSQLAHYISIGQIRSSRKLLRDMQAETSAMTKDSVSVDGIRWMDHIPMTALACVMTMAVATLQCNYERVVKYYNVAILHIEGVLKVCFTAREYGTSRSLERMRLVSLEMMAQCNIMACKPILAMNSISEMVERSSRMGPEFVEEYGPCIQSLLGLYSIYLGEMGLAEQHFQSALRFKSCQEEKDRWIMANANLALLYLSQCKHAEYYEVAERLTQNRVSQGSSLVRQNVLFVKGFHAYLLNKQQECKELVGACLQEAKLEDIFRLHSLGILLISTITGNMHMTLETLTPTLDWSKKGSDHALLQWSNHAIARLLESENRDATAYRQAGEESRRALSSEVLIAAQAANPAAPLIQWFEGDPLLYLPKED